MIVMLDNYDSFTYNLVQYLGELGAEVRVFRNDEVLVQEIENLSPSHIVISPGPGTPGEAGITLELIGRMAGRVPILGVCLGHQAIGQAFGGKVVRAKQVMHGKVSHIRHDGNGVYSQVPNEFIATRYHSLAVERQWLPGGERRVGGRRDHGATPSRSAGRRRAVPPGSAAYRPRPHHAAEFSRRE